MIPRQAHRVAAVGLVEAASLLAMPRALLPTVVWMALATLVVAAAIASARPALLGKRADGSVPAWSLFVFWPWHVAVRSSAALTRRMGRRADEVVPGWWVGVWPHRHSEAPPWQAILDLTCELPRRQRDVAYLCLPTWDGTPPSDENLERATRWLLAQREAGRSVLIHCAAGRGRSVMVLCAGLIAAGAQTDPDAALAAVQRARPHARLGHEQREALNQWYQRRVGIP